MIKTKKTKWTLIRDMDRDAERDLVQAREDLRTANMTLGSVTLKLREEQRLRHLAESKMNELLTWMPELARASREFRDSAAFANSVATKVLEALPQMHLPDKRRMIQYDKLAKYLATKLLTEEGRKEIGLAQESMYTEDATVFRFVLSGPLMDSYGILVPNPNPP